MSDDTTLNQLTLFAGGSHVLTLATPASEQALQESAVDYGQSLPESFASYDPDTSLWRTLQRSLFGGWESYSVTWPRSGMMRSGNVCRLPSLGRLTKEIESSLLPTPKAVMPKEPAGVCIRNNRIIRKSGQDYSINLRVIAQLGLWKDGHAERGELTPMFCEWLMGFPIGWTEYE